MCLCRTVSNPDADVSVQLEESLMQALRQIEATIDSVVSVLSNSIPGFVTANGSAPDPQVGIIGTFASSYPVLLGLEKLQHGALLLQRDAETDKAVNLVQEVYELVADNYLDARGGGFDPQK